MNTPPRMVCEPDLSKPLDEPDSRAQITVSVAVKIFPLHVCITPSGAAPLVQMGALFDLSIEICDIGAKREDIVPASRETWDWCSNTSLNTQVCGRVGVSQSAQLYLVSRLCLYVSCCSVTIFHLLA